MISWLVAQEAKNMVPKLDSYWQDTLNALRDLKEENRKGPQPDNAILVTADVVGLYSNIPQEEGMRVFREALNSSRFRPEPHRPGRPREINFMSRYICFSQNGPFDVSFEELFSKAKNPGGFFRKIVF